MEEMKKTSVAEIILTPFIVLYNVLSYAFYGFKFIFIDSISNLFNGASYQVDKVYRSAKGNALSEEERIYELTRTKPKKQKVYKYSAKTLAKLEEQKKALQLDLQRDGATRSKVSHTYLYKVKEPSGKITTGTMNGFSKLDINSYLLNEGYEVYSIKTSPFIDFAFKESSFMGGKLSNKDLIFWLTQLSTYLKAGLTLNDAIKILADQMKGSKSRINALKSISYELTLGESFSSALEKQGKMFPALLINMVKAAEASGTLIETLDDMADYYTEINETHKQMVSAMTYPIIITVFSIGVIIFILLYVVPQFIEIYEKSGTELSGFTKVIINVSMFLKNNFLTIFAVLAIAIVLIVIAYKTLKAFKTSFQVFLMHIPVIKDIIIYNELTIFSKTFSSLLKNNVFITDSMDILSRITNNEIYRAILFKTVNNIVKGEKISEAFKDHWAIPDVAYYMIVTGESTGDLAVMMEKVSEYYQLLHKNIINNLKSFIEPIMIVFLALIVGSIVIAVIIPLFETYKHISAL